jgi:DNA-binding transcriptional MerR regulator
MNIREFAEHTGLTAHTLRYYERVGLMGQIGREANGHRVYGPQDSHCSLREQGDATMQTRLSLLERHAEKVAARLRTQHEHLARLRETMAVYQTRLQRQGPRAAEPASTASPVREAGPVHRR